MEVSVSLTREPRSSGRQSALQVGTMEVSVSLTRETIEPARLGSPAGSEVGSWIEFSGIVRGEEGGQRISALEYEAYPAMAITEMKRLLHDLAREAPCRVATVIHRIGVIPVGEVAIHVAIGSAHRREGIALLARFMDRLKEDVPIWKVRALPAA